MKHTKSILHLSHTQIAIILLIGYCTLNILTIQHISVTYDEPYHYRYGLQILKDLDSTKFLDGIMPWSSLNALPEILLPFFNPTTPIDQIQGGRYITILFSILLGWIVFKWTNELYGETGAIFSLLLYILSPNIIAHSGLVTTDLYTIFMMTTFFYFLWKFFSSNNWKHGLFSMIALGLAQLTKYSLIFLYPIVGIIILSKYAHWKIKGSESQPTNISGKRLTAYILGIIFSNLLIINAGFLFNQTGTPLHDYRFQSKLFSDLTSKAEYINNMPIPLPYPYVEGLDRGIYNDQSGQHSGNIYLLKTIRETTPGYKGFPGYYFIVCLFKVPIAVQLFIFLSFLIYFLKNKKATFFQKEIYLLTPIVFYFIFFNFFFKRQIGLRHFLIIFPLVYIFCGSFFEHYHSFSTKVKVPIIILFIYLVVSVLSYFPNYIAYCNELVWDKKNVYKLFADSNIDWGQSGYYLEEYLKENPNTYINPTHPVSGKIAVNINNLVGVDDSPDLFKWLRENYEPIDHIGYSFLLYDTRKNHSLKINGP